MQHIQSPKSFGVISPFRADNSVKENEDAYNELKMRFANLDMVIFLYRVDIKKRAVL
jgi:hypothetical protein